jgi:CheY-specific phosphatase CheX
VNIAEDLSLEHEIASIVEIVERRTISFLRDEFRLSPNSVERCLHPKERVLRDITAIVGVGSKAGLYIAFSYDDALIRALAAIYTAGLPVGPGEEELYVRETASDIVNVIVGNITAELATRGEVITLSPPVLVGGARTIQGHRDATVAVLTLNFAHGALDVEFVGPKCLFDEQLNYHGGVS